MRVLQNLSATRQRLHMPANAARSSQPTTKRTRSNIPSTLLFLAFIISIVYITMPVQSESTAAKTQDTPTTDSPAQPTATPNDVEATQLQQQPINATKQETSTSIMSTPDSTKVTINGETYEVKPNESSSQTIQTDSGTVNVQVTQRGETNGQSLVRVQSKTEVSTDSQ
jgi:hypothetical protein